jgi:TolA-binding protein
MKNCILVSCLLFTVYFFSSCSSNKSGDAAGNTQEKQELIAQIDSLQAKMFDQKSMELNKELAVKGVAAYQDFVKKFPEDTASAEYLFRLSDLSRALGDNANAIQYLDRICKNYPTFKKIPECLFLQGYYYQEYFKDTVQAKSYYTRLITKYPTHAFVDDAQALMKMFGKSEEDIIKDFEKKDAEKKKI